jgi:hypothetical protein
MRKTGQNTELGIQKTELRIQKTEWDVGIEVAFEDSVENEGQRG